MMPHRLSGFTWCVTGRYRAGDENGVVYVWDPFMITKATGGKESGGKDGAVGAAATLKFHKDKACCHLLPLCCHAAWVVLHVVALSSVQQRH